MKKMIVVILLVFGGCLQSFAQVSEEQMHDFFDKSKYDLVVSNWNAYQLLSKIMHFNNEFKSGSVKRSGSDYYVTIIQYDTDLQRNKYYIQRVKLRFERNRFRKMEVLMDTESYDTFKSYKVASFFLDKAVDVATFFYPYLTVFDRDVDDLLKTPEEASLIFSNYMWDKYYGK